jgi:hypothetical protein
VVEGGSWGLPPLDRPGPFTVKLAAHSFVASERSQEFSVLLVGDRVEGADKQGAHATVGSSASARSEGGGGAGHLATTEDALDIPQVGQEEGPETATDQGKGAVVWQDALDSLPTTADPDAKLGAADPDADPLEASVAVPRA